MRALSRIKKVFQASTLASLSVFILLFWAIVSLLPYFTSYFPRDDGSLMISNAPPKWFYSLGVTEDYGDYPPGWPSFPPGEEAGLSTVDQPTPFSLFWLFGANEQGQSLFALIIRGASTSFAVSLSTVFLCIVLGVPIGSCAGYFGGKVDVILSRFMDILLAFPPLILPITVMALLRDRGLFLVVLTLSLTGWVSYARIVRGQFISLKQREFVHAAEALGASPFRVMFRHILPNSLSPLVVQATFALATVVISEASLSFLGLGVADPVVSWGQLLNEAKSNWQIAPHMLIFPSLALSSMVIAINFVGEALRKAYDPRSSGHHNI